MSARIPIGVSVASGATVVVCDDGAVFTWLSTSLEGWAESPPIPGSELDLLHKRDAYYARLKDAFPVMEYADIIRSLRGRFGEVSEAIAELDEWVADARAVEASGYNNLLAYTRELLQRDDKWPEWAMVEPSFK